MTDDTKALIEEARSKSRAWGSSDNAYLFAALADALEKAEARERRAVAAVALADSQNPIIRALQAQLQQTQAKLEEAASRLRHFSRLIGPKHTMRQEAERFLASLQPAQETEPRLKGSSSPST